MLHLHLKLSCYGTSNIIIIIIIIHNKQKKHIYTHNYLNNLSLGLPTNYLEGPKKSF